MVRRSWFLQNGLFFTILALVLLIHLLLLAARMYGDQDVAQTTPDRSVTGPPLKVKILQSYKKQIVQSEDPQTPTTPKDSSYLSDKDRAFDRQSVSRNIDKFKQGGKGTTTADDISLSDLSTFEKDHHPLKEGALKYSEARSKKSVAGTENGNPLNQGISSTNDYVEAVPLGDLTYLNTTQYKYYGFYFRIRQKLEQFWGRSIQEKAEALIKEGRELAQDDLITALVVTLNAQGEIKSIEIKGASGVKELDDAAVESFNQAGPFPHPPRGLIENGLVKIEWGFVVKTSSYEYPGAPAF